MNVEIEQLEAKLKQMLSVQERVDTLNLLGWQLMKTDHPRGFELAQEAYQLAGQGEGDSVVYRLGAAESLRSMAWWSTRRNKFDQTIKYGLTALVLLEEGDERGLLPELLNMLGSSYFRLGDLSKALEYQLQLLDIARESNDQVSHARALIGMGVSYDSLEQYDRTLECFTQALGVYTQLDNSYGIAMSYNNIAFLYNQIGEPEKGLSNALESLAVSQKHGHGRMEISSSNTLGSIYTTLERFEEALPHLQHGAALGERLDYKEQRTNSLRLLGELYVKQHQRDEAIKHLHQALLLAEEIGHKQFQYEIHQWLAEAHKIAGDFAQALTHFEQFHALKEIIFTEESLQQRQNMEVLHQTEAVRREAEHYATLYTTEQDRRLLAETLIEIGRSLSGTLDLEQVLSKILQRLQSLVGYDRSAVLLGDGDELVFAATQGYQDVVEGERFLIDFADGDDIFALLYQRKRPLAITDPAVFRGWRTRPNQNPIQCWLGIPLLKGKEVIGILSLGRETDTPYDLEAQAVAQAFGAQAVIAVNNAQLYQQAKLRAEEMTALTGELAQLNTDKDRLFSIISHDLRTPFNSVLGFSKILFRQADQLETAEIKEMAEIIYNSGKNVFDLLEDLLQWSRMQIGQMAYNPENIGLQAIADNVKMLLAHSAADKSLQIDVELPEDINVFADQVMIDTVIRNLVSNGIKFTPPGGRIVIGAQVAAQGIEVAIADNGIGIAAEDIPKLFRTDTFHTTRGTADEGGTGLGLLICKQMIERHQGRIWVESELGQGTSFKFLLPVHQIG